MASCSLLEFTDVSDTSQHRKSPCNAVPYNRAQVLGGMSLATDKQVEDGVCEKVVAMRRYRSSYYMDSCTQ